MRRRRFLADCQFARKSDKSEMLDRFSDLQDYERKQAGRKQIPSMIIIDSKTIQNADTAKKKGYDGGKKTVIKLHIAVDVLGNLYAATVTTANVGDREGAVKMFSEMPFYLPGLQLVLTDGAILVMTLHFTYGIYSVQMLKSQNDLSCINLLLCQDEGLLKELLHGLINAVDSGKTARDYFPPL